MTTTVNRSCRCGSAVDDSGHCLAFCEHQRRALEIETLDRRIELARFELGHLRKVREALLVQVHRDSQRIDAADPLSDAVQAEQAAEEGKPVAVTATADTPDQADALRRLARERDHGVDLDSLVQHPERWDGLS